MKVYDFKVILEPDETGGYVVTCPSLSGCYSQGDTVEEALANIKEAIELCLEDMREQGEQIPDLSGVLVGSVVVTQGVRSSLLYQARLLLGPFNGWVTKSSASAVATFDYGIHSIPPANHSRCQTITP